MAWYDIHHTCGHDSRTQIYGPSDTRQARANRRGDRPCPDCQAAARAEAREAATAEAADHAVVDGLPALTGTEKQIAWALALREKAIVAITTELTPVPGQARLIIAEMTARHTDARWWIDNRSLGEHGLVLAKEVLRELPEDRQAEILAADDEPATSEVTAEDAEIPTRPADLTDAQLRAALAVAHHDDERWEEAERRSLVLGVIAQAVHVVSRAELAATLAEHGIGGPILSLTPGFAALARLQAETRQHWLDQTLWFAPGVDDWLTRAEVAELWGVQPDSVTRYVQRGILPAPAGSRWRRADVMAALADRRVPGQHRAG